MRVPFFSTYTQSNGIYSLTRNECVIIISELLGVLSFWISFVTSSNACRSSPESISSKMRYFGSSSSACRSSIFLFSQPESPTPRSRLRKLSGISRVSKCFLTIRAKINGETGGVSGRVTFKCSPYIAKR